MSLLMVLAMAFVGFTTSSAQQAPPGGNVKVVALVNDTPAVVDVVTKHYTPIKVDTVQSLDEIVDKGMYFIENPPAKDAPITEWIGYIVAIIGFTFGVFHYVRNKKLKGTESKT